MDQMRGMMDSMVKVVEAIQKRAQDEAMDEVDSVTGGIQGLVFEDLSAHLARQVEDTVCAVIVSRNSCGINRISRTDQPLSKFARAIFDPIPGRQPIMEMGIIPAGNGQRGTLGQAMIDTGASFSMVTQGFVNSHNLTMTPGNGTFA